MQWGVRRSASSGLQMSAIDRCVRLASSFLLRNPLGGAPWSKGAAMRALERCTRLCIWSSLPAVVCCVREGWLVKWVRDRRTSRRTRSLRAWEGRAQYNSDLVHSLRWVALPTSLNTFPPTSTPHDWPSWWVVGGLTCSQCRQTSLQEAVTALSKGVRATCASIA